ncbi:MAG: chloramphenicol acetyltransferase [Bacteroidetes bacterium GWF2_43_63]|nr:MAG: chloramphenicol acetyltransferase [Bacteroidetes bacterium GWE2_42_42]OFY55621.1 MAG: chloramphenicol acetyltransferase [Bacteroidetes bacterium GWF2_43_63]
MDIPSHVRNADIGDYTYVSMNSWINNTRIGKFCSIGPNLLCGWGVHPTQGISTSPMFYSTKKQNGITFSSTDKIEERAIISIGNDVFIGANVTILDGVSIGDGAIIGAGAVVSKDIPPYAIAVGVPIQIVKYRFSEEQIQQLLKIKWWDFEESKLRDIESNFFNVDAFLSKNKAD